MSLVDRLEYESAVADSSRRTWEEVAPFFDEKKKALFETFVSSSVQNQDDLVLMKMQMNVLLGMESYFMERINTGIMAKQQLKDLKNGQ